MDFPRSQHSVILADPPWRYRTYSEKGQAKSPNAQYETMSFEDLAAMRDDILFATAPNAVLFMWTTWPVMEDPHVDPLMQALDLMRIWGFNRKTGGAWAKTTRHGKQAFGTGYIFRSADEPFILGTIGNPKIKNKSTQNRLFTGDVPENINELGIQISSLRREHSRKPDEIYELLENLFEGPYLELFSRTSRPGWASWGKEAGKFDAV